MPVSNRSTAGPSQLQHDERRLWYHTVRPDRAACDCLAPDAPFPSCAFVSRSTKLVSQEWYFGLSLTGASSWQRTCNTTNVFSTIVYTLTVCMRAATRSDALSLLKGKPIGTFLVRPRCSSTAHKPYHARSNAHLHPFVIWIDCSSQRGMTRL